MPYQNEHACRIEDPSLFQDDSFRRTTRNHKGKKYSIIMGKKKNSSSMSEQAYRYDKEKWTADEARNHCKEHNGSFELAVDENVNEAEILSQITWKYVKPITNEDIEYIKKKINLILPKDYILCVMKYNNGRPEPNVLYKGNNVVGDIAEFISWNKRSNFNVIFGYYFLKDAQRKNNVILLPFALDSFGNYYCFMYKNKKDDNPQIVLSSKIGEIKNVIASNFTEFMNMLGPEKYNENKTNKEIKEGEQQKITWKYVSPITQEDINYTEKEIGIKLPKDYIQCVLKYNGGRPYPDILYKGSEISGEINDFISLNRKDINNNILNRFYFILEDPRRIDNTILVPFAEDPGGNYFCFMYKDKKDINPQICFYNHETGEIENIIASNFTEFMNMLHEEIQEHSLENKVNKSKLKLLQEVSNRAIDVIRRYRKKTDTPESRQFFKDMMKNSYDINGLEKAFLKMQIQFKEFFEQLSEESKNNILEETKETYKKILYKLNQDSRYNSTNKERMAYILALNFMFVYTANFEDGYDRYVLSKVKNNFENELNTMLFADSYWQSVFAIGGFFFAMLFYVKAKTAVLQRTFINAMAGFFVAIYFFISGSFDIILNAIKNSFKKDEVNSDEDIIDYEETNMFINKQLKNYMNIFSNKQINKKGNNIMENKKIDKKMLIESVRSVSLLMKKLLKQTSTPESRETLKKIRGMEPKEENLQQSLNLLVNDFPEDKKPTDEYQKLVLNSSVRIFRATGQYLKTKPQYADNPKTDKLCFVYTTTFMSSVLIMNDETKLRETEEKYIKQLGAFLSSGTIKSFVISLVGYLVSPVLTILVGATGGVALIGVIPVVIYVFIHNILFIYGLVKDLTDAEPLPDNSIDALSSESVEKK